ncbi:MAG: 3-isopropylmalate dehydratase small subunit [Nitrospira sp.]|nr:3-isopropylmalate dehydratase small subunit [Nitrospira sp.]MCA9463884.1 3-isopropylmalate dehydratase small subunit [Nitrospira sp.]MCA9476113.1 3-isopropylmalate dehydratase small subunit [Nitrospira sp.]MCA9479273.1 3-isopropylmalate dehydratase small subunit [Nitrospira sp.]MCB9711590.1 3-isopropylmalate dehydratase small subunit [Nitrospiraceae bacterium]
MQPFTILTGTVAPLNQTNVDTDQIIPKQYLKTIHRTGLKEGLFADWRQRADGSPNPDFFMNQARYSQAPILVTGENFGCGSSREHAPWALLDYGIRSIVAPSFADIFYNNCFQNGILPVVLEYSEVQTLFDRVAQVDHYQVTIDLPRQRVCLPEGEEFAFTIDPFRKDCLLKGLDAIGITLQHKEAIDDYEARRSKETPWLFQEVRV